MDEPEQHALTGRGFKGEQAGVSFALLAHSLTQMAATVEELYRNYGILADAKEDLSQVCVHPGLINKHYFHMRNICTVVFHT